MGANVALNLVVAAELLLAVGACVVGRRGSSSSRLFAAFGFLLDRAPDPFLGWGTALFLF
jgi:hypothetical protein